MSDYLERETLVDGGIHEDDESSPLMTAIYGLGGVLGGIALIIAENRNPADTWVYWGIPVVYVAYVAIAAGACLAAYGLYDLVKGQPEA